MKKNRAQPKLCKDYLKNGEPCTNKAKRWGYCGIHQRKWQKYLYKIIIGSILAFLTALPFYLFELYFKKKNEPIIIDNRINDFDYENEKWIRTIVFPNAEARRGEPIYWLLGEDSERSLTLGFGKLGHDNERVCQPFRVDSTLCGLSFLLDSKNRLLVSADIYGENGEQAASLVNNKLLLNHSNQFMFNRDDYGFEIVDNHLNVILSVDLIDYNTIKVRGMLKFDTGFLFCTDREVSWRRFPEPSEKNYFKTLTSRLFEYHDPDWRGKRLVPKKIPIKTNKQV